MSTSDNVCKRCGGVLSFQFSAGIAATSTQAPPIIINTTATNPPYTVSPFDATVTAAAGLSTWPVCSCAKLA